MSLAVFFLSILTSIIGSSLLTILGFIIHTVPKKYLRTIGIVKVFKNQKKAINDIISDINKSGFILVLAMKGDTFSFPDKDRGPLRETLCNKYIKQNYLISSPNNDYIAQRGEELGIASNFDNAIKAAIGNFDAFKNGNHKVEVRQHKEVIHFRLIILEKYLYLSFQESKTPGRDTSMLKIIKESSLYKNFNSIFVDLWEKYDPQKNT